MRYMLFLLSGFVCLSAAGQEREILSFDLSRDALGVTFVNDLMLQPVEEDWLVHRVDRQVKLIVCKESGGASTQLVLTNGLVSRSFLVTDNIASVSLRNLSNGAEFLRAVKPEARVMIDSVWYDIGGLRGQPEASYLLPEWYGQLSGSPNAFRFTGIETSAPVERYSWRVKYNAVETDWPPKGLHVTFFFEAPEAVVARHRGLRAEVHYEMYEGLPVIAKWIMVKNNTGDLIVVNAAESEVLAVTQDQITRIHVESDYSFAVANVSPKGSALMHFTGGEPTEFEAGRTTTRWLVDPEYTTWATHNPAEDAFLGYPHQNLLVSRPPVGPSEHVPENGTFRSFVTFELLHDSDDRERQSLAHRRMYRKLAPQVTESLLTAAITSYDVSTLKDFIDQMAELGFERLDIHPGPGISHDNLDPKYIALWKEVATYARNRGIIMGGYELLVASRGRGEAVDVVDYKTGKPGSLFGQSVCMASKWYDEYFSRMWRFFDETGFRSFDMDGPYHGDVCASTEHKHHVGLYDSQWQQWKKQVELLHELQRRDYYIPIPDWYFLNGQSSTGMGYREASANLTPQQQLLLGRQYIYDGTWHKAPTMGWMTLQLVGFYTSDPRVGLEPLSEHIDQYERGLVQHLGSGCQFTVRGNRLYDTSETKAMVKRWIGWFKKYRDILTSDIIHVSRPTGRDLDYMLHVNAQLKTKGLAIVFNPTDRTIRKDITIPLYYTGLTDKAYVRVKEEPPRVLELTRDYEILFPVEVEANGFTWIVIE